MLKPETAQVPIYEKKPAKPVKKVEPSYDFFGGASEKDEAEPSPPPEPPKILRYESRKTGMLIATNGDAPLKTLRLPRGGDTTFSIETAGTTPLAVMTLTFPGSPYFHQETIRLVAIAKTEEPAK